MAIFEPIVQWVLYQEDNHQHPGAISNLGDNAGLTRFGITQKNFSSCFSPTFWTTMDFQIALNNAKIFYENQFWHHINGDSINNDRTAALLMSASVNIGISTAVKLIQNVLQVSADGILGLATLHELNSKDPQSINDMYRAVWNTHYRNIVDANPNDAKFLQGWLNRVDFPYPSPLVGTTYAT
jgi:lysozyme family protein